MKTVVLPTNHRRGTGPMLRLPGTASLILALCAALPTFGADWEVRQAGGADFTSIQAAIGSAGPGDTITVLDSATYVEDVSFITPADVFITLQAAAGERPTIQALNAADRFSLGAPDYSGVLVMVPGVTVQGFDILNDGDANFSALGVGSALSIHASNVSIMDCDLSQAGGTVGPQGSTVVSVSDFARLAGGPDTVENVVFTDCVLHDGTGLGMSVFPFSFNVNPGIVGSVHHVRLERCVIRNCARQGFETDGLGSVTLTEVTVQSNAWSGMELGIEQVTLTDCESSDNGSKGVDVEYPDVVPGDAMTVTIDGLTCIGNGAGGLNVAEGIVVVSNLVLAANGTYNLNFLPVKNDTGLPDVTLGVDHATLYYPPGDSASLPNVLIDAPTPDADATLTLKNAILVGPVGIYHEYQDLPKEDVVADNSMFWNGVDPVFNDGEFTEINPVAPIDPQLVDPLNRDFRLAATSPVATADSEGGPLGGAGIAIPLPAAIVVEAFGMSAGHAFLEWESHPDLTFDIHGGGIMSTGTWTVLDSVTGMSGTQHWDDSRSAGPAQYYRVEGRQP